MCITQEADYAVRIVHCLARERVRKDARAISDDVSVTLRFSLKILGKLGAAGIVKSFKGNRGGYELAREPADISLLDVISAVDGKFCFCRCIEDGECNHDASGKCAFQSTFGRITDLVNRELAAASFSQFLDKAPEA